MEQPVENAQASAQGATSAEIEKFANGVRSGANWFYWIAGLSLVNSVVQLFQGEWSFVIGLGITQVFDAVAAAVAEDAEQSVAVVVRVVAFGLDVFVALVFALFGWLANRRMKWAFVVGVALYTLDGLLFLLVQDWLSLGFHGFALFCIFGGYGALKRLEEAEAAMANMPMAPENSEPPMQEGET